MSNRHLRDDSEALPWIEYHRLGLGGLSRSFPTPVEVAPAETAVRDLRFDGASRFAGRARLAHRLLKPPLVVVVGPGIGLGPSWAVPQPIQREPTSL